MLFITFSSETTILGSSLTLPQSHFCFLTLSSISLDYHSCTNLECNSLSKQPIWSTAHGELVWRVNAICIQTLVNNRVKILDVFFICWIKESTIQLASYLGRQCTRLIIYLYIWDSERFLGGEVKCSLEAKLVMLVLCPFQACNWILA